jgi:hypothetical protein
MDPDIGVGTLETTGIPQRADSLAIAAAQAPIRIDKYDFHEDQYLPVKDLTTGKMVAY